MRRRPLSCAAVVLACLPMVMAESGTATNGTAPRLTVTEIVGKNVAARGGLTAWRSVHTLEMKGKMDAGGNNRPTLQISGQKSRRLLICPRDPRSRPSCHLLWTWSAGAR